jgi:uncharacterized phage protein gp47/JayE
MAGAVHLLYGAVEWAVRQLFPDQSEEAQLLRQAAVFGITKIAATYATGVTRVTGTIGQIVPSATLARVDGAEYTLASGTVGGGGYVDLAVTAVLAGAAGTVAAGDVLSFSSPVSGIDVNTTVQSSTADGADEEDTESLRSRFLARLADPPHGGTETDYVAWAREVGGVTRAWVVPQGLGPGTVVVYFARDNDASPIPSSGEVAAVQAHLDEVAPVTAEVTAAAPTALSVNYSLHVVPDTSTVRAAVSAELADLHVRTEPGATLLLSAIRTAIGTAPGLTDYTLTTPSANVVPSAHQIPLLGTVTYS